MKRNCWSWRATSGGGRNVSDVYAGGSHLDDLVQAVGGGRRVELMTRMVYCDTNDERGSDMPDLTDEYTYDIDAARAAAIPMIQRAARDEAEEGHKTLNRTYAEGIDDILTWLAGEVSHSIIGSRTIREAAKAALTVQTTACRHCGHGIGYSETEGWVAPDAGFDREGGDGIWRDMCPDRDDEPNPPHEPETPVAEHVHIPVPVAQGTVCSVCGEDL